MNLFDIKEKIVLITGGAGFLGNKYAEYLIDQGCKIIIWDLPGKLQSDYGGRCLIQGIDIKNHNAIKSLLKIIKDLRGCPDALINNAGVDYSPGKENTGYADIIPVNFIGAMNVALEVGMEMTKNRKGSIINIGSLYGLCSPDYRIYPDGFSKPIIYGATKAALGNVTKYLASIYAVAGVRVNTLIPGGIENNQPDEFKKKFCAKVPMGRMGKPEDLLGAVHYLISDASQYMTGASMVIDGGYLCW